MDARGCDITHLWLIWICGFKFSTKTLHFSDASVEATAGLDDILFTIEPEAVCGEGGVSACSGGTTEVVLAEGDGEGGVGGENELLVALAPVSKDILDLMYMNELTIDHFIQAMLTGAEVVAWKTDMVG